MHDYLVDILMEAPPGIDGRDVSTSATIYIFQVMDEKCGQLDAEQADFFH